MKKFKVLFLFTGAVLWSCKAIPEQSKALSAVDFTQVVLNSKVYQTKLEGESFLNGELLHKRDLLKEIEALGCPFFNLLIACPEKKSEKPFGLNIEDLRSLVATKLMKINGKYVEFPNNSEKQNSLLDIKVKGVTIFDPNLIAINDENNNIMSISRRAEQSVAGNFLGTITITPKKRFSS